MPDLGWWLLNTSWNDYKDLDVKGKIVLVLVNDPGFGGNDTTFFKGNTMTYYGRWTYKFEEAARRGAKGCLVSSQHGARRVRVLGGAEQLECTAPVSRPAWQK